MSTGAQKAFELQRQVRHNASEYQNSLKDLYTWEQDIKNKEKALKDAPKAAQNNIPIRSHVDSKEPKTTGVDSPGSSTVTTPTEKQDLPKDTVGQQHKKANDIKDRGNNYVKQADYARAIEAYTEALAIYPYDPVYYINRALCHLKQERYDSCVEDCEAAIALDKLCVKAYYRRMQANESLGNNMEALKDCTAVLAIEPKNMEAKKSLARINERLRKNATKGGPNFTADRKDLVDILAISKPPYKRSKKPMRRVPIVDIVSPRVGSDDAKQLRISDDDIDKIFNSNCGPFEELKKETKTNKTASKAVEELTKEANETVTKPVEELKKEANESLLKPAEGLKKEENKPVEELKSEANTVKSEPKINQTTQSTPKQSTQAKVVKTNSPTAQAKTDQILNSNSTPQFTKMERSLPPAPAGTAQFYITWKELSPPQKYQYLKSIEIPNLCKILGAGFDSDTFTDLLNTLHDYYLPNKEPTLAAVLQEISLNDEFTILAMLMSQAEKKMISSMLKDLKNWPNQNDLLLDKLTKVYNMA